ncbi:RICIN domain-containing protein [Allorhizocola rhizosphaerae]|uniref:RICIN domain-containing protein n=1 Tax=Allorhizocola rhizosphaerae TaxID=1872709 RepID=UPI001FE3E40F|nr:ricin-type beta-trefoil lectin domain protein [Allorhizocola rhizosphaerae]
MAALLFLSLIAAPSAAAQPDRPFADDSRLPSIGTRTPITMNAHAAPRPVVCDGDGVTGKRVQLLYVHGDDQPSRYTQIVGTFQSYASDTDDAFVEAARRLGGGVRHVRYVTGPDCRPTVDQVPVPSFALPRFGSIALALRNAGYNRVDRKYVVWAESTEAGCAAAGTDDERPGPDNPINSGPHYAVLSSGCWGGWDFLGHELLHVLGAVGAGAPHGNGGGGHCWDQRDVMCYDDTGSHPENVRQICAGMKYQLDCNGDDYFHTSPAAGTYLATHWNVANSEFLIRSGPSYPVGAITGLDGKCIDVANSGTGNGTRIQLWGCNGTNAQRWTWRDGTLSALGKCLDVVSSGTVNGTRIHLWDCNGSGAQRWEAAPNGALRNPQSGRCLDARYNGVNDDIPLQIWDCRADMNQRWTLPA